MSESKTHHKLTKILEGWRGIGRISTLKLERVAAKIRAKTLNSSQKPSTKNVGDNAGKTVQADGAQTQPGTAGVLGDACGDAELERNDINARHGGESLEVQPAPLARPDR